MVEVWRMQKDRRDDTQTAGAASVQAFRRILATANTDAQTRVDAVVAMRQRTVILATFETALTPPAFRLLRTPDKTEALAVFTDVATLARTAERMQWRGGQAVEMAAHFVFRWMTAHKIPCLWVDPGETHSVTFLLEEVAPWASEGGSPEPAGPFAGAGALPERMKRQVRAQRWVRKTLELRESFEREMMDGRLSSGARISSMPPLPSAEGGGSPLPIMHSLEAVGESSSGSDLIPLMEALVNPPTDSVVDAWRKVLAQYPEVEWACYAALNAGQNTSQSPVLGLRIEKSYRVHAQTVARLCTAASLSVYPNLTVVFIDSAGALEQARKYATVFYPWRSS